MLQKRLARTRTYLRRTIQAIALAGTLIVGIVALALIVSQTPWFRDWLRKFVVRQAAQYVNGTLSIGSLGGNLFYGVELGDVEISVNGERIVALKRVEIAYDVTEVISRGRIIRQIVVREPYVLARHDATGWNLRTLVKRQEREANRQGPSASLSLPDIQIVDGRASIDDRAPSNTWRLPSSIEGLNANAGFEYEPVHYSVTLNQFSFTGHAPDLAVQNLAGRFGARNDDLHVEKLFLQTPQSALTVDGVIRGYLATPSLELTVSAPTFSLPEFAPVVLALRGYDLHPTFDVKTEGRQDALKLALNVQSEAGDAHGVVTADFKSPDLGVGGEVNVRRLDLAPLLKNPAQRSDITGHARLDVRVASAPAGAAVFDRLRARIVFDGPAVTAMGYSATAVRATATLERRRITIVDSRANAYGGSATARGFIVTPAAPGRPTVFDLAGSATHVNLRQLPRKLNVPHIQSDLSASAYHVKGSVARTATVEGNATMRRSTIADGTIVDGTTAEFSTQTRRNAPADLTYAGHGEVHDVNLQKVGEAFQIAELAKPGFGSHINTTFDVKGSGSTADAVHVEGTGTATDSRIFGGTIPRMAYQVSTQTHHDAPADLTYTGRGEVRDVNLQKVGEALEIAAIATPEYDSHLNAAVDVKGSGTTAGTARIDATGTATDSQIYGGTVPRMAFEAHLDGSAMNGRGDGEFRDFDPARLLRDPQYAGHVSGTVDASFGLADTSAPFTPDGFSADGRITLGEGDVAGITFESADVEGKYATRHGTLTHATVTGPDVDVQASGEIALDGVGHSDVKYHIAAKDLAMLGKRADQPDFSGSAVLDGAVTGNGTLLTIAGKLDGANVGYKGNTALDLNSDYSITVPDLTFARAAVKARSSSSFVKAFDLELTTAVATTAFENKTLTFDTKLGEAQKEGSTPRELDASGSVIFHPDHSEIHLPRLALRTNGIEWQTPPGSQAAIQYGPNSVEIKNVTFANADQSIDIAGTFALGDTPKLAGVTVAARNVDVAQVDKLLLQNRGLAGRLNGQATLTGNANAPDAAGHLEVANGAFRGFTYQSLTADGTFSANRIGIDARLVQTPGVELTAKGTVPLSAFKPRPPEAAEHVAATAGDQIDLHVQSTRIGLGVVQGFISQVQNVTGTVEADVHVSGSGLDPHLTGYVDFKDGAFAVPDANVRFSGMTTRIELQPDRIHVPRFQILDQHGNALTIQGELAVHEGQGGAVNVAIESNDFKIVDNELGNLHLQTNLKLTGEVRRPRIEGEVRTDAARFELDKILLWLSNPYSVEALPDVVSAERTVTSDKGADEATRDAMARGREVQAEHAPSQNATAPTVAPTTGIFSATELNVRVIAPDNAIVRGDDIRPGGPSAASFGALNATMGADLQLTKRVDGPVIIRGTARTIRGFYEFQGRRFTLLRDGTLQFRGLPGINPDLDVTGERLIPNSGVTARIHISGTPRSPRLTLTSTPPLDEADILSLIVFNRSVNQLGTGERVSLAETAGGIASGFVAQSLGRSIGRALDVDLFEITATDPQTGEAAGGLTLGKQISDKAYVRFRQQFGQRSFTEFMLEYQLARFLRVDTQFAPETSGVANRLTQRRVERAGIDLIFFFSY